jgi:hypothetical protein
VRQFVKKMERDPETREVDLQLRLPGNCANRVEAAAGVEPANKGFADLCLTTWLRRHDGAENGIRTRDPQLGKLLLYQLSYFRSRPTIS